MADAAHQTAEEQPNLQLTVHRLRPRHASGLARQQLHHALVSFALQHLLQEARLARQGNELLEVLDGRPAEVVQVVRHAGRELRVHLLRLRVGVVLDPAQYGLHAAHMVIDLLLEICREHAHELLRLAGGPAQDRAALPLQLGEATLLGLPQPVVRLVEVGQGHERVLGHDDQHDTSDKLITARVLAHALGGPRMPCEAGEAQDVADPGRTESQREHAAEHQHRLRGAADLHEVVQVQDLQPPVRHGAQLLQRQPHACPRRAAN
mmetsp:Transcript_70405/g.205921  ORF Transcript_70405/g.205921 Transcript_70405/m.205921 type:complete len:264 (+) Transcript_70405:1030-1821(+)